MTGLRSLLSGSAVSLLGTAVSAALSVVYISVGARLLGPESYASVAVAISTANIVFIMLNPIEAGLTLRVAGFQGRGDLASLHTFFQQTLRGLVVTGALGCGAWAAIVLMLQRDGTEYWLALFCAAQWVGNLPRAGLRGRELFGPLSLNWVLESFSRLGFGLGLIALAQGASGMVAGYALGTTLAVVHASLRAQRGLPAAPRSAYVPRLGDLLLPLKSTSSSLLGLHLYTALVVNLDVLAASHFLPAHEAGLYGGSASLARIVLVGAQPLLLVLFSRLANMSAARADTRRVFRIGALVVLSGLGVSLIIPAFFATLLLRGFLGAAYADAGPILLVQWATACVLIAQAFFAESLLATSQVRGGFLFVVPAFALAAGLMWFHDSPLVIAQCCFVVCATIGSLTFLALWRLRRPLVF